MRATFGDVAFDGEARRTFVGDREVHLSPKAFELLEVLVQACPRALSRDELQDRLWPATLVTDSALSALVSEVRRALGDDARRPRVIRTVFGFGYALAQDTPAVAQVAERSRCWLEWGRQIVPLEEGANVLGRDARNACWIGDASVSRRHARITLSDGEAVLEDLGSKNGTFLGAERLAKPARLSSGDTVRIGEVTLVYRHLTADASTESRRGSV